MDRLDLGLSQVDEDNDEEMDGDLDCSSFVWSLEKPFGIGKLVRRVRL